MRMNSALFYIKKIIRLRATHRDIKAHAIFNPLDSIDTQHRLSQGSMQLTEYRFAESDRHAFRHTRNYTSDGISGFLDLFDKFDHLLRSILIRTTNHITLCLRKIKSRVR